MAEYIETIIGHITTMSELNVNLIARTECVGRRERKLKAKIGDNADFIPSTSICFMNASPSEIISAGIHLEFLNSNSIGDLLKALGSPNNFAALLAHSSTSTDFLSDLVENHSDFLSETAIDELTSNHDIFAIYPKLKLKLNIKQLWNLFIINPYRTKEWMNSHQEDVTLVLSGIAIQNITDGLTVFKNKEIDLTNNKGFEYYHVCKMCDECFAETIFIDNLKNTVLKKISYKMAWYNETLEKQLYIRDSIEKNTESRFKNDLIAGSRQKEESIKSKINCIESKLNLFKSLSFSGLVDLAAETI